MAKLLKNLNSLIDGNEHWIAKTNKMALQNGRTRQFVLSNTSVFTLTPALLCGRNENFQKIVHKQDGFPTQTYFMECENPITDTIIISR
jgi:hypothetical protein